MAEPPARVALDEEQLGFGRIALLAIGELAGQVRDVERALAARQLARLARGLAGDAASAIFCTMALASLGCSSNQVPSASDHGAFDHRAHLGGNQLVLGLAGEFRVGHLHRQHAGQPLARIVAGELHLLLLGDAALGRVGVDRARQRGAEAGQMGAAVALRDVVGEAEHAFVIAVVPPQGGLPR